MEAFLASFGCLKTVQPDRELFICSSTPGHLQVSRRGPGAGTG